MILADKIINLRKKRGWSQEQLAEQLNVSRQSVSKWESALSIPDMDKIVKMSYIFGVSTDYLLKDEIESAGAELQTAGADNEGVYVSVETANNFLRLTEATAGKIAFAISMFVFSPVPMLFLAGVVSYKSSFMSEDMAGGIGAAVMLTIIAICVAMIITNDMKMDKYRYIEKEDIVLEYGLAGIVEKKMNEYRPTNRKMIALGVALCIAGVVPLLLTAGMNTEYMSVLGVCTLLICIALGIYWIVLTECINDGYKQLLQIDDFTPQKKYAKRKLSFLPGAYWCIVLAVYLAVSFYHFNWQKSWIIWPVAALTYAAVEFIAEAIVIRNK